MSNLREKARAVKAAGEAERGNFEPTGAPKRLYDYWLNRTKSRRGRDILYGTRKENFCHFWRVVLIWAPLMWVSRTLSDNLGYIAALAGLVALSLFAFALFTVPDFWLYVLQGIGFTALLLVNAAGIIAGVSSTLNEEQRVDAELMRSRKTIALFGVLGFAGFAIGFVGTWIFYGAHALFTGPAKRHPKAAGIVGATLLGVLAFGFAYLAAGLAGMGLMALILGGSAAVVALGVFVAMVLSDYVSGKRALAEQQRELYYETHGEYPKPPTKEPSVIDRKVAGFFRGLGDFIVLIAQVVRVNKWKICPIVEVKTDS